MKKGFTFIPKTLKSKYSWGDIVPTSGIFECSVCENLHAFKKGEHFSQCQDCINNHEERENKWLVTNDFVYFISKNINLEFDQLATLQTKLADWITELAGTLWFVYFHILWFALWIFANLGYFGQQYVFDPYPFGLLTMIVSLEAIFLATFIMISQNISSQKSELRSEHEYQVNLETEKNVAEILALVKEIRKETELKTNTLTDTIEEIKETISEIVPESDNVVVSDAVPLEAIEKEHFEEQAQILDEAGIDMMHESAPTPILEEKKIITRERTTRKSRKKNSIKKFKKEFVEDFHDKMNFEK